MLPDRVSNPGPLTYESGALPIALPGPVINKELHPPLMHRYLTFHMQDSGQYSINTEGASRLQLKLSIKQFGPSLKFCQFAVLRPTRQNRRDPKFFFAFSDFLFFFSGFPRTPIVRRKQTSKASSNFQNNQCTPRF